MSLLVRKAHCAPLPRFQFDNFVVTEKSMSKTPHPPMQ